MTFIQTRPPAGEALTLAEAKLHLRLDTSDEDGLIQSLIVTARDHLERATGLCLMTQGWRLVLESVSEDGVIQISKGPVQTVDLVTIYDAGGAPHALDASLCLLDGMRRPARLLLGQPMPRPRRMNGIEIEFTAGFGEAATEVPDSLKRAMLTHVAAMYACRGVVAPDMQPAVVPPGYDRLLAPFLCRRL